MTLKDDLVAARSLIDTPEKWAGLGGWKALLQAIGEERAYPAYEALERITPNELHHYRYYENDLDTTHADIMALFQRAIDACEPTP